MRSTVGGMRFTYRDELCMLSDSFLETSVGRHVQS